MPKEAGFGLNVFIEEDNFNKKFNQDRNYTGGGAISLTGAFTSSNWFIASFFRKKLDGVFKINSIANHYFSAAHCLVSNSFSFGTTVFTPEDLAQTAPVKGDRPYSSLTFLSSKQVRVWADEQHGNDRIAITTELVIGSIGTDVGDSLQTWIHRSIIKNNPGNAGNRPIPQGWKNQISNGGEPTAMYRLSIQQKLGEVFWIRNKNIKALELSSLYECQLGYYTNAAVGLTLRAGFFKANFWQNNSNFGNSINQFRLNTNHGIAPNTLEKVPGKNNVELYAFVSVRSRLIGYNALLQGQFKKSVYTLGTGEMNHLVNEFEIGIAARIWRFTGIYEPVAGRTSELNTAYSRTHIWGAFNIAYNCPIKL